MIEILRGSVEESIIKILRKKYPITVFEIKKQLIFPEKSVERVLKKFQIKKIVELEPLSDKIYVRLLRNDFSFIGMKRQKKLIKHSSNKNNKNEDYEGFMYS